MDIREIIQPGMKNEAVFTVQEEQTAIHIGSGGSRVLATPWMIALMERVSHQLLAAHLPSGWSSVGVEVCIRHLAPTPAGSSLRVVGEVLEVDGLRVSFTVQAFDEVEMVGEGRHERFVIDEARFLRRVARKQGHE